MSYPFTLLLPLVISVLVQATLWVSYLTFISFLDRTATLWLAWGGAAAAAAFLVVYRFFATDMKSWNLALVLCSLFQFAAIANSLYFVWLILFQPSSGITGPIT